MEDKIRMIDIFDTVSDLANDCSYEVADSSDKKDGVNMIIAIKIERMEFEISRYKELVERRL